MGKVWVKEFTGGLDTRRMPVSTTGAVLMEAVNGHITRGGEFEKREAFINTHTLPAGKTVGLASTADGLYSFGHLAAPAMPAGIAYQRLIHPNNAAIALTKILSWDLYAGKLYVSAEFASGERFMFYDGVYVNSWADGNARGTFTVKNNDITPAAAGVGSFRLDTGATPGSSQVTSIKVTDISLIIAAIPYVAPASAFMAAIVNAINARTGITGFSASRKSWTIYVKAPVGDDFNGVPIDIVVTSTITVNDQVKITGGVEPVTPTLETLRVGKVKLINAPVPWVTDVKQMVDDIAAAINAYTATSHFSATAAKNQKVIVRAEDQGDEPNGDDFSYTASDGLELFKFQPLDGGTDASLPRGVFNKTISQKEYAVAGSVLYFTGVAAPTEWATDAVGAGFLDVATEISGAERLQAIAKYQSYIAIFAEETTIIEYIDPDPTLNRLVQVLAHTGTFAPQSVTQFGDKDIYYLDKTGLRSLQARDASNAAATTDIGVMIDALILDQIRPLTSDQREAVIGLIEPQEGRFWLIIQDRIYVFSYFQGSRVSAWSTYSTTYFAAGVETPFITEAVTDFNKRLYLRAGDKVFAYGGSLSSRLYDATKARARIPFLDANDPIRKKSWNGVDAAVEGVWSINIACDPLRPDVMETVANIAGTTFDDDQLSTIGQSTHISVAFESSGNKRAVLSSCVIQYEGDQIEDR